MPGMSMRVKSSSLGEGQKPHVMLTVTKEMELYWCETEMEGHM